MNTKICFTALLLFPAIASPLSAGAFHSPSFEMQSDRGDATATETSEHASQAQDGGAQCSPPRLRRAFDSWLEMAEAAEARQPDWLSPLATTSGRIKQELRFDIFDQPVPGVGRNYQFGGNKGLELITSPRTQILLGFPSLTVQSANGPPAGFGDLPLMLKFRIASAVRGEGNYLFTFILAATAPTGSQRYGSGAGSLTPTLAVGKGWGRFDLQSTVGENFPAGRTSKLGRQFLWNTALQYQARWKLWPELEANATFFQTGNHSGQRQVFLTPGLGFGRMRLNSRFRFSTAAGVQIAITRLHTYNHRWILSERLSF